MKKAFLLACLLAASFAAVAQEGKIRVCRRPGIIGEMDGKTVHIPADTYTGSCNRTGENCRDLSIAGEAATLGPAKSACVIIKVKLLHGDGRPINPGEELRTQWSIAGFEPVVRVVSGLN